MKKQEYNPHKIEAKWQKTWIREKRFKAKNHERGKENSYILVEFPYPSGKGLHVGHPRSYIAFDIVARKKRIEGKNVLFPMGCDAFGLEAERTAIREGKPPQEIVERNIKVFREQLEMLGIGFDWDREVVTCRPDYYKWTQWIFLQLYKKGLAYKGEMLVNWCPECGVLANEEVENGHCCQCHKETEQKVKTQWVLKMTDYADKLEKGLDDTEYLENIKTMQRNWIGRSMGAEIDFEIKQGGNFQVFTTCIETVYGITYMVLAPENKLVRELKPKIKNWDEVEKYINETKKKSEFERTELIKEKTGCRLEGITVINPVNFEEVPLFISDYVLANYGTGAVMAVPAHDERDYDFAKKFNLPIKYVIEGPGQKKGKPYVKEEYADEGTLINSEVFSGFPVSIAKNKMVEHLRDVGIGREKVNYKMRDWIFARQRYWGEPIPMVYCEKCGWVPVPEKDLPVVLPKITELKNIDRNEDSVNKDITSPLEAMEKWVNTKCPHCKGAAKRETDTMPGWAGSSWYFLRYCDPHNRKQFASMDALKAWLPVEIYNGGMEHVTRHLLYARFWNQFLFDEGLVPVSEPFKKRVAHGLILGEGGVKMSKSLGNTVDPRDVIAEYSTDAFRLWEMFIADYSETCNWSEDGVKACHRMINRVWDMQDFLIPGNEISSELSYILNYTIKKVGEDIDSLKFNTAVSAMMILVGEIYKLGRVNRREFKDLLTILNPFAPHVTEELWNLCKFYPAIKKVTWPKFNESALVLDEVEIPVQINGKVRGVIKVKKDASEQEAMDTIKQHPELGKQIQNVQIKKVIYITGKIFNIVV